jgi:transmembrane sensor
MGSSDNTTDCINIEATEWALRREQGELPREMAAAFAAWCAADSRHLNAYRKAAEALVGLSVMGKLPEFSHLLEPLTWGERWSNALSGWRASGWTKLAGAVVAGMVIAVGVFVAMESKPSTYETAVGQVRTVTLDDGTVVTLGADSGVKVAFSHDQRHVSLVRGDAFFSVARDTTRPFVVAAGATLVRVVGTKFDVHRGAQEVKVVVVEGTVEVSNPEDPLPRQVVSAAAQGSKVETIRAGEQIVATRTGSLERASVTTPEQTAAWRAGRLDYNGVSLREVVADANRYYSPGVTLESDELGDLQVTTSFRTTQIEQMVDTLTMALPVDVERSDSGKLILHRRK